MASAALSPATADPVDEKLVIDDVEIVSRAKAPEGLPFDEVLSGWLYREAETRALEEDSFENPGMLAVERGEEVWNTVDGSQGKSCASCHNDAAETMKGIAANYPKWDVDAKRPINIELQIDKCRIENMGAEAYKFNAEEQVALTTYIKHQSLGAPVSLDLTQGELQSWWDRGKDVYYTRTGQLNLACASCHEANAGKMIRADHLSQGQANGFPTYRLKDGLVSLHQRFRGCVRDTRAETPKAFSDDLMALELYVTWRGTGLAVETPAVRH
ncbi:sulfur oxidation c-type cytochrome SoxA [Pseudaminobacter arsenicus]|uniref:SoxAX cytochrome complex subunit A n=1 Tax=Borborobacter arsenicus TaxID=1851146 RepID=A0A432V1T1_9HYPH|nr:sulfur oxidation c-type cytochrome SoxA [Pseudaminobacter arsenicus]RUM96111.1 sulfur oxidation c-type cytochrome SoxA [Pseudaminobacter arsenicus]